MLKVGYKHCGWRSSTYNAFIKDREVFIAKIWEHKIRQVSLPWD